MPRQKILRLILGDQLNENHDWFKQPDEKVTYVLMEIRQETDYITHHIQRLMVTGNFALLAGVNPAAVDEWYLGIYIDAIQWVELPNTRAMSQFADGGQVATKPYISSAKYIHSMSDYCDSCKYTWKQRHGDMACPFNSLYWNFFERHRPLLQENPRVGMMYRVWDRMESKEKKQVLKQADACLKNLDRL